MASTRELWVVLRARDEASRVVRGFSRNVAGAGNSLRGAQLSAQAAALRHQAQILKSTGATNAQVRALNDQASALSLQARNLLLADKIAREHERTLRVLASRLSATGDAAGSMGIAFAAAGAIGLFALKRTVDASIEYERQVRHTATQVDGFRYKLEELAKVGLRIANELPVQFDQIQPALFDIFSSMEVGIVDAEKLLRAFSKGAVAGQTDIQAVSRATIGLLNAFHRPASDVTKILDIQFQLIQEGIGTYEEWNQRIGLVTPSAVRAGQSIEVMAAALATATRMGISAARSGTSVARAMDALSHPLAVKNMEALGIKVRDAAGKFLPLNIMLRNFRNVITKMPEKQRLAALLDVFKGAGGTIEARRFIQNIILGKGNLELFDQVLKETSNSAGSLEQAYTIMANATASKTELLRNKWNILKVTVGEALVPAFTRLVTWLGKGLDWFNKLPPGIKRTISLVLAFASAAAVALGAIMLFIGAVAGLIAAFIAIGAKLVLFAAILTAIPALIVGVVAAFALLWQKSENFRSLLFEVGVTYQRLWVIAKGVAAKIYQSFVKYILPPLQRLWQTIENDVLPVMAAFWRQLSDNIVPKVVEAGRIIGEVFETSFKIVGKIIDNVIIPAIKRLTEWWNEHRAQLAPVIKLMGQMVKWFLIVAAVIAGGLVVAAVASIAILIGSLLLFVQTTTIIVKAVITAFKFLQNMFTIIWVAIRDFFVGIWQAIVGLVRNGISIINGIWQPFWQTFGGLFKAIWGLIVAVVRLGMTITTAVILIGLKALQVVWSVTWNILVTVLKTTWNIILGILRIVVGVILAIGRTILSGLKGIWRKITDDSNSAWGGLFRTISKWLQTIWKHITDIFGKVIGFFANAGSWLFEAGKNIVNGLIKGITSKIKSLTDTVNNITETIRDHFPFSPAKRGALAGRGNPYFAGRKISEMLSSGMVNKVRSVAQASALLASTAAVSGNVQVPNVGVPRPVRSTEQSEEQAKTIHNTFHIYDNKSDPRLLAAEIGWELEGRL